MTSETITPGRVITVLVIPPVVIIAVCALWAVDATAYAYRLWRTARTKPRRLT